MPISTTIRTAIIIVMTAAFGSTRIEEKDLGWICREAIILGKSATGAAMIMAIVMIMTIGDPNAIAPD